MGARRDPSPPVGQYQNLRDGKLRLSDAMFAQMMGWNKRVTSRVVAHTQAIVCGLLWMHESKTYVQFTETGAAMFA